MLLRQLEMLKKCLFQALYVILKVPISRKLYVILDWLIFQNYQKTHVSISISHNLYIKD